LCTIFNLPNVSKILTMIKKVAITFVVDKESKIEDVTKIIDKISECLGKDTEIYYNVETENLEQLSSSYSALFSISDKIEVLSFFTGLTKEMIVTLALKAMEENKNIPTFNEALDFAIIDYYAELMKELNKCESEIGKRVLYKNLGSFKELFDFYLQGKFSNLKEKYKKEVEKILKNSCISLKF